MFCHYRVALIIKKYFESLLYRYPFLKNVNLLLSFLQFSKILSLKKKPSHPLLENNLPDACEKKKKKKKQQQLFCLFAVLCLSFSLSLFLSLSLSSPLPSLSLSSSFFLLHLELNTCTHTSTPLLAACLSFYVFLFF